MVLHKQTASRHGPSRLAVAGAAAGGAACLLLAAALLSVDPVQIAISYKMVVRENGSVMELLRKPVPGLQLRVRLFNVSNAARFTAGAERELRVQEVGPFTYSETRYHDAVQLDAAAGVVRYSPRVQIQFTPEESAAHPDDVTVTVPNLPMLGLASMVSTYPYWTRMAFNLVCARAGSQPTVSLSAGSYLWGYRDPLLSLAHGLVPGFLNFDKLGILDQIYDKRTPNRLELSIRNEDKFSIKIRNGHKKLPMGKLNDEDCKQCDDFANAYEGLGFPSPTTPQTPIKLFRHGLCKLLPMDFREKVMLDSRVEGLVFHLNDSFFSLDHNTSNNMQLDLQDCFYGLPLTMSKFYFKGVDPEVYARIKGLPMPDDSHETYIVIEPKIAMVLETHVLVQLNLVTQDLRFSRAAAPYSRLVIPLVSLEIIQSPLPQETQQTLHLMYRVAPLLLQLLTAALLLAGAALLGGALLARLRTRTPTTTRAHQHFPTTHQTPLL